MTKEQCLEILKNCQKVADLVEAHMTADGALHLKCIQKNAKRNRITIMMKLED